MKQTNPYFSFLFLHYSIVLSVIVFTLIVYSNSTLFDFFFINDVSILIVGPIFASLAILFHHKLFNYQISRIQLSDTLEHKFTKYQSAHIIRLAVLETAAMINLAETYITGNTFFLIIASLLLFIMLFYNPSKDKISNELRLSRKETKELFGKS